MNNATPTPQPFATWNSTRGVWETMQLDLSGQPAPYSAIWPTCGTTPQWIGLPASLVGAPHPRLRVFILAHRQDAVQDTARDRLDTGRREPGSSPRTTGNDRALTPDHRPRPPRTGWLTQQEQRLRDPVVTSRGHPHRWGRYAGAIAQWEHITGRPAPAPALLNEDKEPLPSPEFVEWLMGLPSGWVTDPAHGLTANQQTTALGNGVLPAQAATALTSCIQEDRDPR